jgi:hypothetical protein
MLTKNSRRVRGFRAGCEALEGRDLQAVAFSPLARAMLNPQPLPPHFGGAMVRLNPQPLPPHFGGAMARLNPQPLPPGS